MNLIACVEIMERKGGDHVLLLQYMVLFVCFMNDPGLLHVFACILTSMDLVSMVLYCIHVVSHSSIQDIVSFCYKVIQRIW